MDPLCEEDDRIATPSRNRYSLVVPTAVELDKLAMVVERLDLIGVIDFQSTTLIRAKCQPI